MFEWVCCFDMVVLWYKIFIVEDFEWICCYYCVDLVKKVFGVCVEVMLYSGEVIVDELVVVDVYLLGIWLFECK